MRGIVKTLVSVLGAMYLSMSSAYAEDTLATVEECGTSSSECEPNLERFIRVFDGMSMTRQKGYPEYTFSRQESSNRDGKITQDEYVAGYLEHDIKNQNLDRMRDDPDNGKKARAALVIRLKELYERDFKRNDVNGDGFLTMKDDYNNDGAITLEDKTIYRLLQPKK